MDVYERLQVRTVINAFETVSIVGGTRIRPEVLAAMQAASERFVFLPELQEKVGDRIAQLTRNEAAVVTNGALAGMLLATAACLARANPGYERPLLLPYGGRRNRVIVQRCQYSPYLPNITQVGAELVEVGYSQQLTPDQLLEAAFDDRTAAVFFTAGRPYERFAMPLERVVEIAHERGVPVIVDGAALLPPPENLWRFTEVGADLAVFSGGKGLRGPQDSGVVVGERDLIQRIHRINSPIHGLGRALKTTKEDIIGFLVALELALEEDQAARYEALDEQAQRIAGALAGVAGIETRILPDGRQGQPCPRVVIRLLPDSGWSRQEFTGSLAARDPAILVGDLDEADDSFYVNPLSLTEREERLVIEKLTLLLTSRRAEEPAAS
jgi:D-glucosaminate-6-phosphate ammonia-lyase